DYIPRAKAIQYDDSLRLVVETFNKTIHLHLAPNHDLFHPDAVFHQNGLSVPLTPSDFRVYKGFAVDSLYSEPWWVSNVKNIDEMQNQPGVLGSARIILRNDINIDGDIHHIKLKDTYRLTKRSEDTDVQDAPDASMVIYRDSDKVLKEGDASPSGCGFDHLDHPVRPAKSQIRVKNPFAIDLDYPSSNLGSLSKRAPPTGCPTSQKVLYMGVAADCTYTKFYKSTDAARMQIINDWNSVSSVYSSSFNIGIGLINITIMDSGCPATVSSSTAWNQPCSTSYSISQRLSDFSRWRGSIGDDGAGLWHLMTNCATGQEVGVAWLSQVCNTRSISRQGEYTSGTGVSSIITDEWKVVAHEIGHGFGAIHDCNAQTCPCSGASCQCCPFSSTQCDAGGRYFMNPTSNASSSEFSPCSISTICKDVPNFSSCLQEPGTRNITTLQQCGNGIVEAGEDCDPRGVDNACCDSTTCKFKPNAVCDDVNDLCCDKCQFRPANYTCRASSNECDIAEVCTGTSGKCPKDLYKDDLTSCGNGLQCASGQCTSRDQQCVSRGTTYNIKSACGATNGCQVTCQDPRSVMACITFPGSFADGTPCGIGGVCSAGRCNSDNVGNNIKNWIETHKEIVIPVAVIVGLLLLICLYRCCCYRRTPGYNDLGSTYIVTQPPPPQPMYPPGPPPHYPPGGAPGPYYTPPGWVDPAAYNGTREGVQPPLPSYSQSDPRPHDIRPPNSPPPHQQMPTPTSPVPVYSQANPTQTNRPHNEGVL
ncbi:Metallo-peptidase family M12B Reprolysin-like-domain-containing protein, partial [Sporodiniella umbellata]